MMPNAGGDTRMQPWFDQEFSARGPQLAAGYLVGSQSSPRPTGRSLSLLRRPFKGRGGRLFRSPHGS